MWKALPPGNWPAWPGSWPLFRRPSAARFSVPQGAQRRAPDEHGEDVPAPTRVDVDVRERLALLVCAAPELLRERGAGGGAGEITETLHQRRPRGERADTKRDPAHRTVGHVDGDRQVERG